MSASLTACVSNLILPLTSLKCGFHSSLQAPAAPLEALLAVLGLRLEVPSPRPSQPPHW